MSERVAPVISAAPAIAASLAISMVLLLGYVGRVRPPRRVPLPATAPKAPVPSDRAARARRQGCMTLVVAGLAPAAVLVLGPLPTALAATSAATLVWRRRRRMDLARRQAVDAAMPAAIELLVLCIHAGCSPTQAVVEVAARAPPALAPVFGAVQLQLHRGRSLADALGALADGGGQVGRDTAAAIAAADRDGLPLAPVLDRLAADARVARRRLGEAAARQLPVRLTFPLVTCTLPSFVLLAIAPAVLGALSTLRANAP